MNRKIMKHLLWKDARTIGPLAIAIPVLVLLFFGSLGLLDNNINLDGTSRLFGGYTIWFLLPILIAYGAPAVLVGGEEENGSLAWLRTLPAKWSPIAGSKLIVASACLGIAWIVATLCFLAYWASIPQHLLGNIRPDAAPEPFWLHVLGNVWLSVMLLLSSFITAYLLRSPITALLAVVPVMLVTMWLILWATFSWAPIDTTYQAQSGPPPTATILTFSIFATCALLLLFVIHQICARQRLSRPTMRIAEPENLLPSADAFRPPPTSANFNWYGSAIAQGRPPKWFALSWQHLRQMGWHYWFLIALAGFGAMLQIGHGPVSGMFGFFGLVAGFCLGPLTFYGDSVKKRCQFLADRGVSPTMVWVTRVAPMLIAMAALWLFAWICIGIGSGRNLLGMRLWEFAGITAVGFAVYSLSQLTSQWSPRPVLTFFAAPVFCCFGGIGLAALFEHYSWALWVVAVSGVVLLFASWRLTPRWMSGETGKSYNMPLVGYVALALVLPYALVLGGRWLTAPSPATEWRQQMLSMNLSSGNGSSQSLRILDGASVNSIRRFEGTQYQSELNDSQSALLEQLNQEIADEQSMGEHISLERLGQIVNYGTGDWQEFQSSQMPVVVSEMGVNFDSVDDVDSRTEPVRSYSDAERKSLEKEEWEIHQAAAEVLLKWSTTARKMARNGEVSFTQLFEVAENSDYLLGALLPKMRDRNLSWTALVDQDALNAILSKLPGQELVDQSRRISLIRDWQRYNRPTASGFQLGRQFAGLHCMAPRQSWLAVERMRSDRYLDRGVQLILSEWESGADFGSPDDRDRLDSLLEAAHFQFHGVTTYGRSSLSIGSRIDFARLVDDRLTKLRAQAF